ncbi:DUF5677 domain-containing protein [Cytobacillus oceanisediminis]|uniref:DUF5677 domain-containing protein n=1 Tax=Cytobacillus oceanisediminis TaxID=665099 RepID=UPI001C22BCC0|nr:DUF5677 domain-containing protein [Cytobacillus oceanisediminis]MBU8773173.1 hypothetical protein [Cytobacillus oceanisediminis]
MKMLKKSLNEADKLSEKVLKQYFELNRENTEFDTHDAAIIGLFEDMIGKVQSLIILIENNSHNGADAIARMIMENYTFIKFILEKDTKNRGESYYQSLKIHQLKLHDTLTQENVLGREVRGFLGKTLEDINSIDPKMSEKDYRNGLVQDYLTPLNLKDRKSKWYNFNGEINNFRELCKYLKMEKDYVLVYQILSQEVHSQQADKFFKFEKNLIRVNKKNDGSHLHIPLVNSYLIDVIRMIYTYYGLKSELKKFNTLMKINYTINR